MASTAAGLKRRAEDGGAPIQAKKSRTECDSQSNDGSSYGCPDSATDEDMSEAEARRSTPRTSTQPSTPGSQTATRPREKKFVCDFPGCGKTYVRPVRLAEHQRSHTNERPFVCTYDGCDKSFLRDSHLKHHVKARHEDVRDYPCDHPDCSKAFHTATRLKEHKKTHDRAKEEFRCSAYPPCTQQFRKQDTLHRHVQLVHLKEKPFVCDHVNDSTGLGCGARFKTSTNLISHKDREHSGNRFWCNICSPEMAEIDPRLNPDVFNTAVGFPTYAEMQQHVKTMHPPTCPHCNHICASNRDLKAHVEIQHETLDDRRNFVCDYPDCGRGFTKKGNLEVHRRNVHAKHRQFVCGETEIKPSKRVPEWDGRGACSRGFGTRASLEEHVRTQHLHLPRTTRKTRKTKDEPEDLPDVSMQEQDLQPRQRSALQRLTGVGYDIGRDIACVESTCWYRCRRFFDLEIHLKTVHQYPATEAIETVKEQEALSGGDFWYGGSDADDLIEVELAQRLHALDPALEAMHSSYTMDQTA